MQFTVRIFCYGFAQLRQESKQRNLHKYNISWDLRACSHKYVVLNWATRTCVSFLRGCITFCCQLGLISGRCLVDIKKPFAWIHLNYSMYCLFPRGTNSLCQTECEVGFFLFLWLLIVITVFLNQLQLSIIISLSLLCCHALMIKVFSDYLYWSGHSPLWPNSLPNMTESHMR